MSIYLDKAVLIDREAPQAGGWKVVVRRRRGNWITIFRGTRDECHDFIVGGW